MGLAPEPGARVGGLDGLRGIAVAAVVVYHARPDWLPGGWLGVDVFFVLSGFLITTLLVEHGRGLRDFWTRRVRRLVPALVLVVGALAAAAAVADDRLRFRGLRGDGLASLAQVVNWRFASAGEGYFDRFAEPSLVRHLWSLSVEAQFYLVWPLVLALLLRFGRRKAAAVTLGLAVASAVAMLLTADVARAYFGTDTHAYGLLLGSALALVPIRPPAVVGWLGLAGLALSFVFVESTDLIPVVAIATAAVVATAPGLGVLSLPLLRALGVISYGVYLWHWPVLQLLDRWSLPAQLATTLALALASWYLVERPVLSGKVTVALAPAALAGTAVALAVFAVPARAPQAAADAAARARSALAVEPAPAQATVVDNRVLVVGDSVAYTLFPGLRAYEAAAGLEFVTATETGCPLDIDAFEFVDDSGPLGLRVPAYCDWRATWPGVVERTRPEIVVALWGLWDTADRVVAGETLPAGSAEWTARLERMFGEAVDVLTARGARVIVLTTPYIYSLDPARVDALNAVFDSVAERRPAEVAVLDIQDAVRAPGAQRWDAVHFTEAGAGVVAAQIVPELGRLAGR